MEVLNATSLAEAFRISDQHPGVNIGIACSTRLTASALIDSLWAELLAGRLPGWEMGRGVADFCEATLRNRVKPEPGYIEIFVRGTRAGDSTKFYMRMVWMTN